MLGIGCAPTLVFNQESF